VYGDATCEGTHKETIFRVDFTKEVDGVTLLPIGSGYFLAKPFLVQILQHSQT